MGIFYIDGKFVDEKEAVLPVTDLAILRGYAVFDFLRTYNGRPFHLEAHLQRLQNSAALIGLDCHWSLEELSEIVDRTLARNSYPECNIRLLITGGDSEDSISPGRNPRLLVMVRPVTPHPDIWYEQGAKIITARLNRYIPGAKSTDYIRAIVTLKDAEAAGAIESVYVNKNDQVLEGTTSNLFIVRDNTIVDYPDDGFAMPMEGCSRTILVADILGDWREEVIRSTPGNELRIYTTTIPATDRRPTLLQDPIYRIDVANNAMGYGQTPMVTHCLEKH